MNPIREKQMPEYLIDMRTMTTFWVTAPSEKKALEALMEATYDLELRLEIGEETPIQLVNITCRDEDPPEVIDAHDDDADESANDDGP